MSDGSGGVSKKGSATGLRWLSHWLMDGGTDGSWRGAAAHDVFHLHNHCSCNCRSTLGGNEGKRCATMFREVFLVNVSALAVKLPVLHKE